MRHLGQFLLIAFSAWLIFMVLDRFQPDFLWLKMDKTKQQLLEQSTFSLVHRQVGSKWIEFTVNRNMDAVRLLTNAVIPEKVLSDDPDAIWHYAIEYEFYDDRETLLTRKKYYHRSKINWLENERGERVSQTFFLDENGVPTSSAEILIRTESYPGLSKVRIRTYYKDESIAYLVFRLYQREAVDDTKIDYIWQRLSPEEKEKISRYSVYGSDFLREFERYQMLKFSWRPSGPSGISEQDYLTSRLYISQEEYSRAIEDKILPALVDADRDLFYTLPIPEQGGQVELHIKPLDNLATDSDSDSKDGQLHSAYIKWFGKGRFKRQNFNVTFQSGEEKGGIWKWQQTLEGGLLQLQIDQPVSVRAWLSNGTERYEITPPTSLLSAYTLASGEELNYSIDHIHQMSTPVKLVVRAKMSEWPDNGQGIIINYRFLSQGRQVKEGHFVVQGEPSFYDRLMNSDNRELISKPFRYYFNVPPEVDQLQVSSNIPVFLNAYNQPADYYYRQRIPESYYEQQDIRYLRPLWFRLMPNHHEVLLTQKRQVMIRYQKQPPEDEPVNGLNEYFWEDYFPQKNWQARYLFNPRKEDLPVKDEALSVLYRPVAVNQPVKLNLVSASGVNAVEPVLIYIKNTTGKSSDSYFDKPEKITVTFAGRPPVVRYIMGNNGQIKLPVVKSGQQILTIRQGKATSKNTQWFVNYSKGASKYYVRRLSTMLDNNGLSYKINKNKPEMLLSALVQARADSKQRVLIRVTITPDKRQSYSEDYSILTREFDIRTQEPDTERVRVLNTRNQYVTRGQNFYLPLNRDLAEGDYQVRIELLRGEPVYLSLYQFEFGQKEDYQFYKLNVFDEKN